jgi:hypothetical protein
LQSEIGHPVHALLWVSEFENNIPDVVQKIVSFDCRLGISKVLEILHQFGDVIGPLAAAFAI